MTGTMEAMLPAGLARPLALVSVNPLFTRAQVSALLRGAIATALALPALPGLSQALDMDAPAGVAPCPACRR